MKTLTISVVLASSLALAGCGTTTGQRAGSGALMGAAAGGIIGSMSGKLGNGCLDRGRRRRCSGAISWTNTRRATSISAREH